MRAPHRLLQAVDVPGFVARPEMIEVDLMGKPDIAQHVADLGFGGKRVLSRHGPDIEIERAHLRREIGPMRIAAANRADLRFRDDRAALRLMKHFSSHIRPPIARARLPRLRRRQACLAMTRTSSVPANTECRQQGESPARETAVNVIAMIEMDGARVTSVTGFRWTR